MPNDPPLVSVIIPAYNAAAFIDRTLRSVLNQTYRHIEVLVVDDGSTDQTAEIVATFIKQDDRMRSLSQPNSGVAVARNLAITHAKGEFIAPIDADDIWYPENIEKQVQCMIQGGNSVGLVYSWSVDIDESDALLGSFRASEIEGHVYATLICHNFLGNGSATMMRRSFLEQVGDYNGTVSPCEDWDLYIRIAERYDFRVVPVFLIGYRKLPTSHSSDYSKMARAHGLIMQSVWQQHPGLPRCLFRLSSSSLYFYFAYQSNRRNNPPGTLFWIYQAIRVDPVTSWIQPELYRLLLHSLWKLLRSATFPPAEKALAIASRHSAMTITEIEQCRWEIALKLLVGNLLHQVISRLVSRSLRSESSSPCSASKRSVA